MERQVDPTLESFCPRCGAPVTRGDTNHDYVCLETMLMALYQIGVKRGVEGEASAGGFDDQGAEMIGEILAMAWAWREEAVGNRAAPAVGIVPAAVWSRPRSDEDLDTQVARFLAWENIGWLDGRPVSGEAAWYDGRVIRRRFSLSYEDAMIVKRHPLLRNYTLVQVHRIHQGAWEWHVAARNYEGHLESLVREATAPLAICRAAMALAGAERQIAG